MGSEPAPPVPRTDKPQPRFDLAPEPPAPDPSRHRAPQRSAAGGDDAVRWLLGGADAGAACKPVDPGYGDLVAAARTTRAARVQTKRTADATAPAASAASAPAAPAASAALA